MPSIGPMEVILVVAIALLVFGPGKLPELGKSLGSSTREHRKATAEMEGSIPVLEPSAGVLEPPVGA